MSKQVYTEDEQMRRVWDCECIKDLMSRRFMYYDNDMRREEINDLWVRKPEHMATASFGRDWGYYVGMDNVIEYYVIDHDSRRREQLNAACKLVPELENDSKNIGFGCMLAHNASTPFVCLAGDGKTAKGMWYSIGQESSLQHDDKTLALWSNNKIAADFVREDGEWKIWHLVISTDIFLDAGEAYSGKPIYYPEGTNPIQCEFGTPTLPMLTHNEVFLWSDDYPPLPQPYYTYSPYIGYGPEGHPNYREVSK